MEFTPGELEALDDYDMNMSDADEEDLDPADMMEAVMFPRDTEFEPLSA